MVYSPLARLPTADHEYGPVRLSRFRTLLWNPKYLPGKYVVGILKLVAIRLKEYWPAVRITVILLRNTGESVAADDGVLRPTCMNRGPGELSAMGIAHPDSDLALESGADAADPDRITDEVIRAG